MQFIPLTKPARSAGAVIEWLATNSGAHCFQTDPSNRYAFLPHIAAGSGGLANLPPERQGAVNAIFQFKFDAAPAILRRTTLLELARKHQTDPATFCFHPTKPLVYVCNEQASSVTVYALDGSTVRLRPVRP